MSFQQLNFCRLILVAKFHKSNSTLSTSTEDESSDNNGKNEIIPININNNNTIVNNPPNKISPFISKLWEIINNENDDIIGWSNDGQSFEIKKISEFSNSILTKYFKHNRLSSFQRQLNYFGFRQLKRKSHNNIEPVNFQHVHFTKDNFKNLYLIQRLVPSTSGTKRKINKAESLAKIENMNSHNSGQYNNNNDHPMKKRSSNNMKSALNIDDDESIFASRHNLDSNSSAYNGYNGYNSNNSFNDEVETRNMRDSLDSLTGDLEELNFMISQSSGHFNHPKPIQSDNSNVFINVKINEVPPTEMVYFLEGLFEDDDPNNPCIDNYNKNINNNKENTLKKIDKNEANPNLKVRHNEFF